MLKDKGVLENYLTENIDNLELKAGLNQSDIVQVNGKYDEFTVSCA
jgi:NAD-dependent SIR2 family protein deacetylase